MRVLSANVWVDDVFYAKGSVPPKEAAAKIGDHAWVEIEVGPPAAPIAGAVDTSQDGSGITDDDPDEDPDNEGNPGTRVGTPPPLSGPGSSVKAWLDYARANGIDVIDDVKRDDVIQALTLANIPVE